MKIAIIGAAGLRTPLIVKALVTRQDQLGLTHLALMDIDSSRLRIIGALTNEIEKDRTPPILLSQTTDPLQALDGADFVITTFRVGGTQSRVIDERVPLNFGLLGQETVGAGGFAMGIRSIPVLLGYIEQMRKSCPDAWLINFANPAGMLAQAAFQYGHWPRTVGICDVPATMLRVAEAVLGANSGEVFLGYFGLNHLGWIRSINFKGQDQISQIIDQILKGDRIPGLPFEPSLIATLGLIPNEYLYFYYYTATAVQNILQTGKSRGEQVHALNQDLFNLLLTHFQNGDLESMHFVYQRYLDERSDTYMVSETSQRHNFNNLDPILAQSLTGEGYARVALNLMESLLGIQSREMIINIPNQGAILGMEPSDVVEIPALIERNTIVPRAVGDIPGHCLGLMKQVKAFEIMTIEAALESSYAKALVALTLNPLVHDYNLAKLVLDAYIQQHQLSFPKLH